MVRALELTAHVVGLALLLAALAALVFDVAPLHNYVARLPDGSGVLAVASIVFLLVTALVAGFMGLRSRDRRPGDHR